ncbi:uncharacterized protein lrrc53 [Corythoichthys intestinalis]|uniref:uncharacterized protein lrrc53 n=1 Tax=Corythoichthys intestinalis TaxID=161448 RepID=UPI0025A5318A|nr:uncharacterized protein lrrc53 [Corythoichthys intestinalis]
MVCVSADNPAVTTVLELTEANCVPSNQNITVQIEKKDTVTPQVYARDLAITAVLCFLGGICLTLLIVLIYYQVSHRKKAIQSQKQRGTEEGNGPVANYLTNHYDVDEKHRKHFLHTHHLLDSKSIPSGIGTDGYGSQFHLRADEDDRHFMCPDCKVEGSKLNQWDNGNNGVMLEGDMRRLRMLVTEEEKERKQLESQQEILGRGIPHNVLSSGSSVPSSRKWKDAFSHTPDIPAGYQANNELGVRFDMGSRQPGKVICKSCHRANGKSAKTMRESRIHSNMRDTSLFDDTIGNIGDRWRGIDSNQLDGTKNLQTRNVTFSMERNRQATGRRSDIVNMSRNMEREVQRHHKGKLQSSGLLKSKPNLKPLRKAKVHPKRKTEQQRNLSKRNDRRQEEEQLERLGSRGSSGEHSKGNNRKAKKIPASEGLIEDDDKKDVGKDQRVKATSDSVHIFQDTEGDQAQTHQRKAQLTTVSPATGATDTPQPIIAEGTGQSLTAPHHEAKIVLGSSQLSSQQPFLLSAADMIHSKSHLLQGSADSQQVGSNLSVQGGSLLLNTAIPAGGSLLSSGMFPNMVGSSSISLSGVSDSRQVGFISPVTSLLASPSATNPMQSSVLKTSPLHGPQPGGLEPNIPLNTSNTQNCSKSQLDLDTTLEQKVMSDPGPDQGLETVHKTSNLASESEPLSPFLPITKSPSMDNSKEVNPQLPKAMNTVENLSKSYRQIENQTVAVGPVDSLFDGGRCETELQAVSEGDILGANVSPQGESTRSTSTSGSAKATSPLLQQEYLSEEGGSSSRRKLRLVLPEKTSNREPTPLEKKIR